MAEKVVSTVPPPSGSCGIDPLIVSVISLLISVGSLIVAGLGYRSTTAQATASSTRQIIGSFNAAALTLPTAGECFSFANQIEPSALDALFANKSVDFKFSTSTAQDALRRCLATSALSDRLSEQEALKVRTAIAGKLNSFQEAYRAVRQGEGEPSALCRELKTGFEAGPKQLILRVLNQSSNRPPLFQSIETELPEVIDVSREKLCQI